MEEDMDKKLNEATMLHLQSSERIKEYRIAMISSLMLTAKSDEEMIHLIKEMNYNPLILEAAMKGRTEEQFKTLVEKLGHEGFVSVTMIVNGYSLLLTGTCAKLKEEIHNLLLIIQKDIGSGKLADQILEGIKSIDKLMLAINLINENKNTMLTVLKILDEEMFQDIQNMIKSLDQLIEQQSENFNTIIGLVAKWPH